MKQIMVIMGTRPEAIKLCPLVRELKKRPDFFVSVCSSGQHRTMLDEAMQAFDVKPDFELDVMRVGQGVGALYARLVFEIDRLLAEKRPDLVLVQGDTATAYAGAQAAFYRGIAVGHVEAGLRTNSIRSPFPEELHRRAIALMADLHFAPTVTASQNLIREGVEKKKVFITGNTVVDALKYTLSLDREIKLPEIPKNSRLILFTAHRRENLGKTMQGMFRALRRILQNHPDVFAICPLHPNPQVRTVAKECLQDCNRVLCIEPPEVISFHRLLARADLVMTDSGGIQEEATALGIPTVVMRYSTERTEGVMAGNLRLSGSGEEGIVDTVNRLLEKDSALYESMKKSSSVYGDGSASVRISDLIEKKLDKL
jgi:UDP-N-acetylglucosamine 2-epimerase (non-hydrolysing)